MKFRKISYLIGLFLIAGCSNDKNTDTSVSSVQSKLPSKWKFIAGNNERGFYYYGNVEDNIEPRDGYTIAWLAVNRSDNTSMIFAKAADCTAKSTAILQYIEYSKRDLKGDIISFGGDVNDPIHNYSFTSVVPDSIGEDQFNFICYRFYP